MSLPDPPLLLITNRHLAHGPLVQVVAAALRGGCRWVSLREKDLDAVSRQELLGELVALARPRGACVMIHDDTVAAVKSGADGVHFPAGSDLRQARDRLGPEVLIGASTHSRREAEAAAQAGANYVTLSPVFATTSKPGYGPALGSAGLAAAITGLTVPVVALGGITPVTVSPCLAAGAAGIAVMGSIMASFDPEAACAALLTSLHASASSD